AHVAAGFAALGDDGGRALARHALGDGHGGDDGHHLDARGHPFLHVNAGQTRAGGDNQHLFLEDDFGHLGGVRAHQHDVDAEGAVRHFAAGANFLAQVFAGGVHGRDDAQPAGVGDRRGEDMLAHPGHAALEDRVLDADAVADVGMDHAFFASSILAMRSFMVVTLWSSSMLTPNSSSICMTRSATSRESSSSSAKLESMVMVLTSMPL